jgi:hypothetical protein
MAGARLSRIDLLGMHSRFAILKPATTIFKKVSQKK